MCMEMGTIGIPLVNDNVNVMEMGVGLKVWHGNEFPLQLQRII